MRRVLIVDDDKLARLGIKTLLPWQRYGMEVVGDVQNGSSALQFLAQNPVDIVFVDLDMPVMDGLTFIAQSKARFPGLVYVVLTFYESFSIAQKVWRLGVIDYISKMELESIDADEVLRRIASKLENAPPFKPPAEAERGADDQAWHAFCREWDDLYFLYDPFLFARLCARARKLSPARHQLEHLVFRLLPLISEHTGYEEPHVLDMHREDILSWLGAYRQAVLARLSEDSDLTRAPVAVARVVLYAQSHFALPLYTADMARMVNLSRSHFSHLFKRHTGIPFNEYLQKIRVLKAARLLQENGVSAAQAAQQCGYEDIKHFGSLFLRHTGMTLREYQRAKTAI